MANALVSFMLQKLDKVYQQEVTLVVGVEEDVKKLTTTFKVIQAVLNDAERRQIKEEAVNLWLEDFKDIAYDMDDVLDEWSYEKHNSQNDTGEGNNKKKVISSYLCSLCSCFSKVALSHQTGTKIKDIRERLDGVDRDQKLKYGFVEIKSDEKPIMRPKTSSFPDVSRIVGRVKDTETIINKLKFLGESSTSTNQPESSSTQALHAPNIISIVGMGGLGKTTLAQRVFNEVKTHFEKTMWVCVSDPFDLVTVTKSIIREAKCDVPNSSEWDDTLHSSLIASLNGKRFLLVLDDVWTEDRINNWENLELSFRYGAKGSRILVTTRNERVALMMKAAYIHPLEELSDNDCSLLLNLIALDGSEEDHEELKKIGEEISKKCKGIPLAAKALGGLLRFKKSKREWLRVLESEIWELEEVEKDYLMPSLLLSYYDLPLHLKGCFVYCSIFPKDHEIEKDVLVKLWMAQGFLNKSTSGNEDLEAIGDDYFNNLAMRSFFQDFTKDGNGNITKCKMHNLVHDLAQYLTKNECSVKHNNDTDSSSRVRHLTIVCEIGYSTDSSSRVLSFLAVCNAKKLRTLQILTSIYSLGIKEAPADLFHRLRCLKVLCLKDIGLENLSGEIENLIHLRYLDLSRNTNLKILPETITNLYNLQTLKLNGCSSLCELPREMRRMINLRHLEISETFELSYIPQGIGGLTCLRTLSDFIVGGASGGCKISELKNLNLLQGDLIIRGLGRVETVNEVSEIQLMKQKRIHTLKLGFEHNEERENGLLSKRMEDVLDVLEPHPDVVQLILCDYLGFKLSRWMESTSIHMKTLKLYDCNNLTKFPAFGQLPSLEVLEITRAIKVKHIGFEFYTDSTLEHVNKVVPFLKLKKLHMKEMKNLEVWELQHGVVMPCLHTITVEGCPKLKALPALGKLPSLEELYVRGVDELTHIGFEFYTDSTLEHVNKVVPFLKLKKLHMKEMKNLEVWELQHGVVMPCLHTITVEGCPKLKALPALGKLPSLEELYVRGADELTHIGCEFLYEVDEEEAGGGEVRFNNNTSAFPKLKSLTIMESKEMEWEFEGVIAFPILPCLRELKIEGFRNSKPFVEILSKISSLEFLFIGGEATEFIKYIRHDDDLHTARETIIFPNLKNLWLKYMEDMEELKIGFQVMPLLSSLKILNCNKLKAIQVGSLESLELLGGCASLYELGIPNLKRLEIYEAPIHPSLLEAFGTTLQATLEVLIINCSSWTCMPEQVQQLTSLKRLKLSGCGKELVQRCREDEGEDWRIISHIPSIEINYSTSLILHLIVLMMMVKGREIYQLSEIWRTRRS